MGLRTTVIPDALRHAHDAALIRDLVEKDPVSAAQDFVPHRARDDGWEENKE